MESHAKASLARRRLVAAVRDRLDEVEQAMLTRANALADPTAVPDPAYAAGLSAAVSAALEYALAGIEAGSPAPGPMPVQLFAQARAAARGGVALDTVLRRYGAGHALLIDFLIEETLALDPSYAQLQPLLGVLAGLVDRLVAAVSEEYHRELANTTPSRERWRTERVQMLLGGEPVDCSELDYEMSGWHLAVVAGGPGAKTAVGKLARSLDARALVVAAADDVFWGWFGSRRRIESEAVKRPGGSRWPADAWLAIGEPGKGLAGWRISHRQASAARRLAQGGPDRVVRYSDVTLLATALSDDLLLASLRQVYLVPLQDERGGEETLLSTLEAYFAADRNVSSAAVRLGVSRKTVNRHLRRVESRLGRPLRDCASELEVLISAARFSGGKLETR